jgi:1-aminocyclopropane-1-carboxylate deaminase
MLKLHSQPIIQEIKEDWITEKGIKLFIKREDLIHPFVSGNKWRKLKYNLEEARSQNKKTLLTFGGAYSNHIYATAAAVNEAGFNSIGVIRGEELEEKELNHTLSFARENGMQLHFVSREEYRSKDEKSYLQNLKKLFGDFFLLPEGGTNNLAIKGCEEIVDSAVKTFDIIGLSVGTGGTISGIISAAETNQKILGFSALKGDFLIKEVEELLINYSGKTYDNWSIETNYHFGGYAKTKGELLEFIDNFENKNNIPLDQVYTGKMMFGLYDKIIKGEFETGSKILAIHTGGLQGKATY